MYTFARTDEQELIAESIARLFRETYGFEARRERYDAKTNAAKSMWASLAELGVLGAAVAPTHGGFAGDARTIAVVMARLGASLACAPFADVAVVPGRVLQHWMDDSARAAALQALIEGRSTFVLAHSPFGGVESPANVLATRSGDKIVLTGSVPCIRYAHVAESFLVPAQGSDGSMHMYHVPRTSAGLLLEEYRLIDGVVAADLDFKAVTLPETACMSFDADVRELLADALEWDLLASMAEAVGILESLNSATFSYLMTRRQFGVLLGSFQALQHRAADMYITAEEALAIVDAAIDSFGSESNQSRHALVSAAVVVTDTAGRLIGDEAVQLHGGMGVSDELIVSHYARRLVTIRYRHGSADAHRLRFRSLQ